MKIEKFWAVVRESYGEYGIEKIIELNSNEDQCVIKYPMTHVEEILGVRIDDLNVVVLGKISNAIQLKK